MIAEALRIADASFRELLGPLRPLPPDASPTPEKIKPLLERRINMTGQIAHLILLSLAAAEAADAK